MMATNVLKVFDFAENQRNRLAIGAGARLNPQLHKLMLKLTNGGYSTDSDIQVATWLSEPKSIKKWLVFYVKSDEPDATSLGYRLSDDGINPMYWDGLEWRAPVGSEWNTESEINEGIQEFPTSNTAIQVIINLKTTDAAYTPSVFEVHLAYESDVNYQEDYVRSLIRAVRTNVRPIADYRTTVKRSTTTITLDSIETPYNIASVDSVFNVSDDPNLQEDLFSSFDSATKTITLSKEVDGGSTIHVRFVYEPKIALTTSQDYTELDKVPAIIVESVSTGQSHDVGNQHIINKSTGDGYVWKNLYQVDIEVPMRMVTDKAIDQQRLSDAMKAFFSSNPFLVSIARDERYRLWLINDYDQLTYPTQSELHTGRLRARIAKALFSPTDAQQITGVKRFVITGGNVELEVP
jgi:hypothetical protein